MDSEDEIDSSKEREYENLDIVCSIENIYEKKRDSSSKLKKQS
jgi:hypothetical protein